MSFHSTLPKRKLAPSPPSYAARDLTQDGDLAQIVLDEKNLHLADNAGW